jgi:2'-5' RNA ligase
METIRAFVAIDLPASVVEAIARAQNRLKPLGLDATWVKPYNVHLTLKFLGNAPPRRIDEIRTRLGKATSGHSEFSARLGGLGAFPDFKRPRVLWIGVDDPAHLLIPLQGKIEADLAEIGFPPEPGKFSPHLTLARLKSPRGKERLRQAVEEIGVVPSSPVPVTAVKLYASRLTPQGSVYTVLDEFRLGKRA